MKFENIIKKTSATVASIVVFLIASGMYLSAKGFVFNPNGTIVLVKGANAAEPNQLTHPVSSDIILPEGNSLGSPNAPVTLYEFSSFGCYHCANFHLDTLPKLEKEYIDQGKLRVVFNDFPLDQKSMQASLISHCFNGSKYFRFISTIFQKQREWGLSDKSEELFKKYAYLNGISTENAEKCLKNKEVAQQIMDNRQYAVKHLGISGTPSFVISSKNKSEIMYGAPSYDVLKDLINKNLAAK